MTIDVLYTRMARAALAMIWRLDSANSRTVEYQLDSDAAGRLRMRAE